ncbi:MAG: SDR family oxidoreductase [Planctomycetes bacterium]|nr:SDR family oxidoreductase [Planctomycetota bacterium]
MPQALRDRIAIVTGASRNVGREVACRFAAEGATVVAAARDAERLRATVARIGATGGTALAVPTDVTDLAAVEALVATTLERFGRIDVLAAIAGGGCVYQPIDAMDPGAWDRTFRTNVTSTFYCARAVLPHYRTRNAGVLLTCSGGGGYYPVLGKTMAAYACAKAAICRLTDQLTAELWETDIRVNALDPGLAWDADRLAEVEAEERRTGQPHPQRPQYRPATHAADLAVWLASDASRPLRGRCLSVYDEWRHDPQRVAEVDATVHLYRLRRYDV